MKKAILTLLLGFVASVMWAQENFPVNGVADNRPSLYAFTNATIYTDYKTKLENATLVIRDGRVMDVGTNVPIPKGAQVVDLKGKYIYPGLIDPYTTYGIPENKGRGRSNRPILESERDIATGWNDAVNAHYDAATEFIGDAKAAKTFREQGFASALAFKADGLIRGTSVFVALSDGPVQESILNRKASAHFSFNKGTSRQSYPNSVMGMVALIRQTYLDAAWYASSSNKDQYNLTLEAFNNSKSLPQVFEANDNKLRVFLADQVGDEFGVQYIIKGNGDEYQRANEIRATGAPLILPLNFPDAYNVSDPLTVIDVSLADMKHWEMAPANASMLASKGVRIAFTSHGLKKKSDFWKHLRKTVAYGLSQEEALRAVTMTPAELYKMQNEVGALKRNYRANFFIASDDIFDASARIHQTWVLGEPYEVSPMDVQDLSGKYDLQMGSVRQTLEVSGSAGKYKAKFVVNDSTSTDVKWTSNGNRVSMTYDDEGLVQLYGWVTESGLSGRYEKPDGNKGDWTAKRTGDLDDKKKDKKESDAKVEMGDMVYPFVAYGWKEKPAQETILIKNATVWTLEGEGKIEGADVLVQNGKIARVGKDLSAKGAKVVDGTGKHLTPGIIDEHSHVALRGGVNEGSESITAEVRMYDVVDSEDVNIYRQLSGGVTAAQLLHGSANPVGGQSALVKFRWGATPLEMRIKGADAFIKFALGENVKQSNWGDENTIRYPQTRMGVEQVFVDGFTRAKAYDQEWKTYSAQKKKTGPAPRRDLELEALAQILNSKRFITCHSYVQSEINMLMKVAEQFNFRINTFTHILEGYKVADKMAEHGVGGSTFSDWWAYKYEVKEAIPYNAALMTMAGVVSAINSDDAEMARRLNQEAAKTVKYGGVSEIEALKMVTLNPAKLLHLDNRMGSIKVGKDADLVLWNDHPLSIYATSDMTMVDGIVYFSKEKDEAMRKWIEQERLRLIEKMEGAKNGGAKTQRPVRKEYHNYECDDMVYVDGVIFNETNND